MHSFAVLVSVLAASTAVSAQAGRFFCSRTVNGIVQQDDAACVNPTPPQSGIPFSQGDGVIPVNSQCIKDVASSAYFCGYNGAAYVPLLPSSSGVADSLSSTIGVTRQLL